MLKLGRLDNIDILFSQKQPMLDFYTGVLGLPLRYETAPGENWFAVQAGDVTIYFFPANGQAHPPRMGGRSYDNPPGIESIAWEVADIEQSIRAIDGEVEWADELRTWEHPSGAWYRMRCFYDPEGNKLWLSEVHDADR